jgi:hypothetical protein
MLVIRIKKVKDNAAKQMEAEEEDKRKHAALVNLSMLIYRL